MPTDDLWKQLITEDVLTRGWHLARLDARQDFSEDLYSTDVYGLFHSLNIKETINRLSTDTYQPRPLLSMEVPKGSLGFRPGSVIPIQDRVIVSSIVFLLAPHLEKKLPASVYSWRLKNPLPKKGMIFKEGNITDLPYLKKQTIRISIDPFEPWYANWPEFDEESRRVFEEEDYRYLATTDIAAYFENIQLPILRDQLLGHFPDNQRIINLLLGFLEAWALRTTDGKIHLRGIPQGNFVSSFLGNLFLLPLDDAFINMQNRYDIRYFRYMDDARIFTKQISDARLAVFTMERELRKLHLNVQTAKTKIYDEYHGEISNTFIDKRVDKLSIIIDELQKQDIDSISDTKRASYLKSLKRIAEEKPPGQQKILGSKRALSGLTSRAFSRWTYAYRLLLNDGFLDRLLYEVQWNPDFKLTKKLVNSAKLFPKRKTIERRLLEFIKSDKNIFEHQEAEFIHAVRYLSNIDNQTIIHAKNRLQNKTIAPYLRMQSAYLLSRVDLDSTYLRQAQVLFNRETNPYVQSALSTLLVQKRNENTEVIQSLVFHPNEKLREIGKFYRFIKNDEKAAKDRLRYIFENETPWLVSDNMPLLHIMSCSKFPEIRLTLLNAIREPRHNLPIVGIREVLKRMFTRTRKSLINQSYV